MGCKTPKVSVLAVFALSSLCGCAARQSELLQAKSELTQAKSDMKELQQRLSSLEGKVSAMEFIKDLNKSVLFDVSEPGGFQRLETNNGTMLVSLKDAQPYLNGYRVTINVGNPLFAAFSGFKIKVKWGKALKEGISYAEWKKSLREKEIGFLETLAAGAWNQVALNVAPASAEELGTFELSMTTDVVSLRRR